MASCLARGGATWRRHRRVESALQNCFPEESSPLLKTAQQSWLSNELRLPLHDSNQTHSPVGASRARFPADSCPSTGLSVTDKRNSPNTDLYVIGFLYGLLTFSYKHYFANVIAQPHHDSCTSDQSAQPIRSNQGKSRSSRASIAQSLNRPTP